MVLNPFRTRKNSPRLEQLRATVLFAELSPPELAMIDGVLHERDYLAGEVIFDEGDDGEAIYIVLDGEVLICRQGEPLAGRLATLLAGDFFGDLALIDDAPRTAQARAQGNARLAVFFRADFLELMQTHAVIASKVSLQLARVMGRRLREVMAAAPATHQHL